MGGARLSAVTRCKGRPYPIAWQRAGPADPDALFWIWRSIR
jgi:hypothetical protein